MTMLIESYSYRDPANTLYGSTHTIVVESTGGTPYTIRHAAPASFLAVLAEWSAAATTATGEPISIAYIAGLDRVRIVNAAGVFDVQLPGSVPEWLGFASSSLSGAASYTGTLPPRGILQPVNVDLDAAEHIEQATMREYRLGRAAATTWHAMSRRAVEIVVYGAADQQRLCGWLTAGRVKVTDGTGVVADGFIAEEQSHTLGAQDGSVLVRSMVLVTVPDDYTEYGGIWGAVRYGWGVDYWLQIAGVDTLFFERASDIMLPAGGYIEEGSLVIDDSAEVGSVIDRQAGIGAGLSLTCKLLDTDTVRGLFARPTAATWLAQTLSAGGSSCTLEDGSVFDSGGGTVHIGLERLTYSSITGNVMSGLTRGVAGSQAYEHRTGFVGQAVTDRIVWWRGRPVVLWAAPMDPMGRVTGTNVEDESVQVWKGRMEADPQRVEDGFQLQCQSLDRVITEAMPDAPTGTVIASGDYAICTGPITGAMTIRGYDDATYPTPVWYYQIVATVLTEYSSGELITLDQFIASLQAAWAAAVVTAGATAEIEQFLDLQTDSSPQIGYYQPHLIFIANSATFFEIEMSNFGGNSGIEFQQVRPGVGVQPIPAGYRFNIGWRFVNMVPWSPGQPLTQGAKSVSVQLDDSVSSDIPLAGRLRIRWENLARSYTYSTTSTDGNVAVFGGLEPADPATPPIGAVSNLVGCTAEVTSLLSSDLPPGEALATMLQSSGTGLRGAYDTESYGYGIDESDMVADGDWTAMAPTSPLGAYDLSGQSAESMICGLLALRQTALVLRLGDDGVTQQLRIVSTVPSGSDYTITITDSDLLGYDDTPVASVQRLVAPNVIVVQRRNGGEEQEKITAQQLQSIQQQGRREMSVAIVAQDRDALVQTVLDFAPSWQQQDGTGQAVELRVPPWIAAWPGDLVYLSGLTHPALWQWGGSESGYDGPARVIGRTMELVTGVVVLTLLVDGSYQQHSLSPAMQVLAYDDATNPTTITVSGIYLQHLRAALEQDATIDLLHYVPAEAEASGDGYTVSAVAESGGNAVLTVSAKIGTPVLQTAVPYSHLTLPLLADCTPYQGRFAHHNDGSYWV